MFRGSVFIWYGSSILGWKDTDLDPDLIRIRVLRVWWSRIEKKSKTTIYQSLGLHKGRPSYRRSLQPSKENIQQFKTWNFKIFSIYVGHFCPPGSGSEFRIQIWIRIHWPDWIRIQSGSGSETLAVPPQPRLIGVVNRRRFDADSDPSFYLMRIKIRIRILLWNRAMSIQ